MSSKRSINHSWSVAVSKFYRKIYRELDNKKAIRPHSNTRWRQVLNARHYQSLKELW